MMLLLWCWEMSNAPRLTALVSRELLGPCYCKPQAGRVSPAHAQWVLARKSYSWPWRDHALSLSSTLSEKQHGEWIFRRIVQVGALASSKKFLRNTK